MTTEYTGQCIGGPDDGNLISATTTVVPFEATYRHALDGDASVPENWTEQVVRGTYEWDASRGIFRWVLKPLGWMRDASETTRRWPRLTDPPESVQAVRQTGRNRIVWTRMESGGHYWSAPGWEHGVTWAQVLRWGEVEEIAT